jgi:hypothetical protein
VAVGLHAPAELLKVNLRARHRGVLVRGARTGNLALIRRFGDPRSRPRSAIARSGTGSSGQQDPAEAQFCPALKRRLAAQGVAQWRGEPVGRIATTAVDAAFLDCPESAEPLVLIACRPPGDRRDPVRVAFEQAGRVVARARMSMAVRPASCDLDM